MPLDPILINMQSFQSVFKLAFVAVLISYHNSHAHARKDYNIKVRPIDKVTSQKYKEESSNVYLTSKADSRSQSQVKTTHHHGMSTRSLIINVIADLCPHGMLPLAFGLMQGPTGIIPAIALIVFFGSISAYTMTSYAKLARDTQSSTIGEIWGKLVNERTKYIADISLFALCFGCCVFYSAFIGDIFSALSSAVGIKGLLSKRYAILGLISATVILPLCQLDDVSALSFSSIMGCFGIFYTFIFHFLRYWDRSYGPKGGKYYLKIPTPSRPKWHTPKFSLWNINKDTLQLVNMLGVAFLAHYNAINYYKELDNSTIEKYTGAIQKGFLVAMTVFIGMMFFGYLIFGTTVQPLILNNFHRTDDLLATFARLATGLAITFAYPLMFAGLKTSLKSLFFNPTPTTTTTTTTTSKKPVANAKVNNNQKKDIKSKSTTTISNNNTVSPKIDIFKHVAIPIVLSMITGIAMKCGEEDVSLVLGVVGSILGCTVAYILPGYLQLSYIKKFAPQTVQLEKLKSYLLMILGAVFSVLGVWITVDSAGKSHH